ncbi:MAG: periplasmic heavy metal sensor [Candidatus Omnitrophica bacterium]|nr:periplasmic heavy metal sensor [Candidatus Omnitrophota bacterium]
MNLTILLIVSVIAVSIFALRQYIPAGTGKETEFLKKSLKLSESQAEEMKNLEEDFCREKGDLCAELCRKRFELSLELSEHKMDTERLTGHITAISSLQAELEKKTLLHLVEMDKVLTPAQKEKFFTMLADELCRNCKEGKCAAGDRCALRYSK